MNRDFTHATYSELVSTLRDSGYRFYRFLDRARADELPVPHVIVRHDVDRFPSRALQLAKLERELGIQASYFFRIKSISFDKAVIRQIRAMDHEIGYHYEELSEAKGNYDVAWRLFQQNIKVFEEFGGVTSIAMHGRPFSKWNNQDLWQQFDYRQLGILLDVSLDMDWNKYIYFTDTGRSWNNKENKRDRMPFANSDSVGDIQHTHELIPFLSFYRGVVVLSIHPERWTDQFGPWARNLIQDWLINLMKKFM